MWLSIRPLFYSSIFPLSLDNPFQQLLTNPKICPESDLSSAGIYVKLYVLIFRECEIGANACLQDTFQAPG